MKAILMTDSCSDLSFEFLRDNDIHSISITYELDGEIYNDKGLADETLHFYQLMAEGKNPTTSQATTGAFVQLFNRLLVQGLPVVYVCFSSALSNTYNSACLARENVLADNPAAEIYIVDSLSASLGQGMLVRYALDLRNQGWDGKAIAAWLEENKINMQHWFTVNDLIYLQRGGRISLTAAFVGNMLNIKPVLWCNAEGKLIPVLKERGRKKALKAMVDKVTELIVNPQEQYIGISNGACVEDAEWLKNAILESLPVKGVYVENIGPVIGSHTGPGVLAVFFLGQPRVKDF